MPPHRRGPWSQAEDHALMVLVAQQGAANWVRISQMIQTRTPKQCRERYHQNLKPNLNHSPITTEEGRQIEDLVNSMGKRWAEIARRLPGRSDNAVKNWWNGGQNRRRRAGAAVGGRGRDGSSSDRGTLMRQSSIPGFPRERYILPPPPPMSLPNISLNYSTTFERSLPSPTGYPTNGMYGQAKGRPEPLDLGMAPGMPHSHSGMRQLGYPTPLPSPSEYTSTSPDSSASLSSGSISISPLTPVGLPPLIRGREERRHSEVAWLPPHTTGFVGNDGHFEAFQRQNFSTPIFREPQWHPRRESPVHRLTHSQSHPEFGYPTQQSLPAYETLQINIPQQFNNMLPSQTGSPPSANRVGIPSIINQSSSSGSTSQAHAPEPHSPESDSVHTLSPPRSSKMDINNLVYDPKNPKS